MKPIFVIIVWIVFAIVNIGIAELNDSTRRRRIANKNPKQIEHFWYGLGYCILCGIPFYISRNYWELFSLLLLHASIFACAYNLFSGNPMFYLSSSTTAITDGTYRKLGLKSIEEPAVISFCISLIMLMLQLFKI
jgi:hypothetical protein